MNAEQRGLHRFYSIRVAWARSLTLTRQRRLNKRLKTAFPAQRGEVKREWLYHFGCPLQSATLLYCRRYGNCGCVRYISRWLFSNVFFLIYFLLLFVSPTEHKAASTGNSLPRHGPSWDESAAPHHHRSWHRNSMRKKHLIELPEQDTVAAAPSTTASQESLLEANELSSISTLPVDEVPATLDPIGASLVVALPPSPVPFVERTEREQIVASAPPASLSSSPQPPQLLETDLDGMLVQERPRQAGRRAQSQPRIGSITVVRDAATNELIIRTNSVPGQSPTAPPAEELLTQLHHEIHHPQQNRQHHHGRYVAESEEGSSMGSSRNPSPVSLLSTTTTCSSIASAADNANDRYCPCTSTAQHCHSKKGNGRQ